MNLSHIDKALKNRIEMLLQGTLVLEDVCWLFNTGGKRLRPRLLLATISDLMPEGRIATNEQSDAKVKGIDLAVAVELLHIASLVHDDLPALDNADERRGQPAAHIKFGEPKALLIGDLLPMIAVRSVLAASGVEAKTKADLVERLVCAYQKLCEGQLQEFMDEGTLEDFIQIAEKKTGALFSFALEAAAIFTDSDIKSIQILRDLGLDIGIYFQGLDDIADGDAVVHSEAMENLKSKIQRKIIGAEESANRPLINLRALIKEAVDI